MEKTRIELPSISSYGEYSSDNYGAHTLKVHFMSVTLYYSYRTIIAFSSPHDGLVVCENQWGPTTGKHLNWIDGGDKKSRVNRREFQEKLQSALSRINATE